MEQYDRSRRHTIENATLLRIVAAEIPSGSAENEPAEREGRWVLPMNRESQLADGLAFIAASTNDCNEVMAVCVEEGAGGTSLIIRISSNSGNLNYALESLQGTADIMLRASPRNISRSDITDVMLTHIVSTDRARILSRLRSRHAAKTLKTRGKTALPLMLLQIANAALPCTRDNATKALIRHTKSQCTRLWEIFRGLENSEDRNSGAGFIESLRGIVLLAHDFQLTGLAAMLDCIRSVDPSTKAYLPEALRKLGHYYRVARDLIEAARSQRYPVFKTIAVVAVRYNTIGAQSLKNGLLHFDEIVSRIVTPHVEGLLSTEQEQASVRSSYEHRLFGRPFTWKVHAEGQLLLFCECNPDLPRPRVICSSKSACYLCDLFFKIHGHYHIPRTHGRIYDRWTLPCWPVEQSYMAVTLNPILERVNKVLQSTILQIVSRAKIRPRHPNESTVGVYEPWSSTSTFLVPRPASTHSADQMSHSMPPYSPFEQDVAQNMELSITGTQEARSKTVQYSAFRLGDEMTVEPTKSLVIPFDTIVLDFSIARSFKDGSNVANLHENSFRIAVKPLSSNPHDLDFDSHAIYVNADSLHHDRETVIPVGPARSQKRLTITKDGFAVAVSFHFATG